MAAIRLLCVNAGSSSIRARTFNLAAGVEPTSELIHEDCPDVARLFRALPAQQSDIIAHRIVRGLRTEIELEPITRQTERDIAAAEALAPIHNTAALKSIHAFRKRFSGTPQVAVYDTAFHRTIPDAAATYPLPPSWRRAGIRRVGYHGLSHRYCSRRAAELLDIDIRELRIVTAHLGNGASLAAVKGGISVDTTMGFTPLDGLMMGSRSGSIDPGALLYLLRRRHLNAERLERDLNQRSGLRAISGSSDMRAVLKACKARKPSAKLAFDMFVHSIARGVGEMIASMDGIDVLTFAGGIGENSAEVRQAVCDRLSYLGISLADRRQSADRVISKAKSSVHVVVVATREENVMAEIVSLHLRQLL